MNEAEEARQRGDDEERARDGHRDAPPRPPRRVWSAGRLFHCSDFHTSVRLGARTSANTSHDTASRAGRRSVVGATASPRLQDEHGGEPRTQARERQAAQQEDQCAKPSNRPERHRWRQFSKEREADVVPISTLQAKARLHRRPEQARNQESAKVRDQLRRSGHRHLMRVRAACPARRHERRGFHHVAAERPVTVVPDHADPRARRALHRLAVALARSPGIAVVNQGVVESELNQRRVEDAGGDHPGKRLARPLRRRYRAGR